MNRLPTASEIRAKPHLLTHAANPLKRLFRFSVRIEINRIIALACSDGHKTRTSHHFQGAAK